MSSSLLCGWNWLPTFQHNNLLPAIQELQLLDWFVPRIRWSESLTGVVSLSRKHGLTANAKLKAKKERIRIRLYEVPKRPTVEVRTFSRSCVAVLSTLAITIFLFFFFFARACVRLPFALSCLSDRTSIENNRSKALTSVTFLYGICLCRRIYTQLIH